jgi:hypothetical protein
MPVSLLPDALALTREALLAQSSLTALVGTRIYDRIPGTPTWPLLVLTVIDEVELEWHTGQPRVQVDVWGAGSTATDAANALTIARTVRSVTRDLRGSWTAGDISNAAPSTIVPAPDQTTGRARYVIDLLLETNP